MRGLGITSYVPIIVNLMTSGRRNNNAFDDDGDPPSSPFVRSSPSSSYSSSSTMMTSNRSGPSVVSGGGGGGRIGDLDANPPSFSSSSFSSSRRRVGGGDGGVVGGRGEYYADDNSDVSSDPSVERMALSNARSLSSPPFPPPPAVIPGNDAGEIATTNDGSRCYCVPRDNKEWCIVVLITLVILGIVAGIGLGLGLFAFVASDQNNAPGDDGTGGVSDSTSDGDGNGDGGGAGSTLPTHMPSVLSQIARPPRDDLGGAIAYHVVMQEISDLASFEDLDGEEGGTTGGGNDDENEGGTSYVPSPQQMARDFMVLLDALPDTLMDEDGEGGHDYGVANDADDIIDPITNVDDDYNVDDATSSGTRPYLDVNAPAYRIAQRYSMIVLYYSMNGTHWYTNENWIGPGVHECDFVGVTCEYISIPSISLSEALEISPADMSHHDDMENFDAIVERMVVAIDLPENNVGGTLPREISGLPYLRRLGLWSNVIGGSVPTEIGILNRLSSLLLDGNLFEGNVPDEIVTLTEMTDLSLGPNVGISGRIPNDIDDLYRLERLDLSGMSLMGSIPTSLGLLANITKLNLRGNRLSRGLPEELGDLINLESLILSENEFTGSIPASWGGMINLKILEIQSNEMYFDVDEGICSLRSDFPGGSGSLETLVTDCGGDEPKVRCNCCTSCF